MNQSHISQLDLGLFYIVKQEVTRMMIPENI